MKQIKILFIILLVFILAGCNIKVNLSPDDNYFNTNDEPQDTTQAEQESDEIRIAYEVKANQDGVVMQILNKDTGEILTEDLVDLCGNEMLYFAHPQDLPYIILKPYLIEEEQILNALYSLNIQLNKCQVLEVSQEIEGNNKQVLSPDQTKLALALEKDEARVLKLLDLVNDKSLILVELAEGETLNGGYGGESNHFDIKWLDNQMIQYTVYQDTFANYDPDAPDKIEKVLQVRVVNID